MIIENSTLIPVSNVFVNLRQDYGATWKGTITIKDSYVELASTSTEFNMVSMTWVNHNFGYASYMPNIVIDNVRLSRDIPICILKASGGHDINLDYINGQKNNNPLQVAKFITLRNNYAKHNFLLYYTRYLDAVEISDNINIIR